MRAERVVPLDTRLCRTLHLHREKRVEAPTGPVPDLGLDPETDLLSFSARQSTALLDGAPFEGFLDYIYMVLLNRRPDPEGTAFYHGLIRAGLSRPHVVQRLLRSAEYRRRSGETEGRKAALRGYVRADRVARLPLLGIWLMRGYRTQQRLERIEVHQLLLARQVDRVRRDVVALLEQDSLTSFANDTQAQDLDTMIFRMAFARARRDL